MYLAMACLLSGSRIAYTSESASFALRPVPAISSITAFTCCFVERKAKRGFAASDRANSVEQPITGLDGAVALRKMSSLSEAMGWARVGPFSEAI